MNLGRPGRGALGLRGRIIGALLVTAVATLAVAAIALLGPLEHSLRNSEKTTLKNDFLKKQAARCRSPSRCLELANIAKSKSPSEKEPRSPARRPTLQEPESARPSPCSAGPVPIQDDYVRLPLLQPHDNTQDDEHL